MLGSHFDLTDAVDRRKASQDRASNRSSEDMAGYATAAAVDTLPGSHRAWHFRCPVCEEPMRVCDERDLKEFGGLDVKLHRLECDACGMLTGRVFHPSVGYDSHLVR